MGRLLLLVGLILSAQSVLGQSQYIYVKFKPETSLASDAPKLKPQQLTARSEVKSVERLENRTQSINGRLREISSRHLKGIQRIEVAPNADVSDLLHYYRSFGNVEEAILEPQVQLLYTPNDPSLSAQDYLTLVKAQEAWDVTQGNSEIVIGISDTGVDYNHEDLQTNRYFNVNDPVNGVDDDGNGYIDDYIGVDLADNDNDPMADADPHGTRVVGVAAASTDSGIGIAGMGFNTQYFPIKVFESSTNHSSGAYSSIMYAADMGLNVINLSWGGVHAPSSILQSIIDYAVLEKNLVIVAAAGNTNAELDFYPASYNHVLSVGASSDTDEKADFATYSHKVDLMAPGQGVYATGNNDGYTNDSGSSYASPLVAATAALVMDVFPELNAIQVMERVRMTTDDIYDLSGNADYVGKLGKGRLNAYRAVSDENVAAMRSVGLSVAGPFGKNVFFGDTVSVTLKWVNVLRGLVGGKVSISTASTYAEVLNDELILGGLSTFDTTDVMTIKVLLSNNTPINHRLTFRMDYSDELGYEDFEYFEFNTADSILIFGNDMIEMQISSNGDLGAATTQFSTETGLTYHGQKVANSMGFMMGNHVDSISDNIITDYSLLTKSQDFKEMTRLRNHQHDSVDVYVSNHFSDSTAANVNGFLIEQEFLAWNEDENDDFLITEYFVTNVTADDRPDMHAGLFVDFGLVDTTKNFIHWDATHKLGYAQSNVADTLMSGLALISGQDAVLYAIDIFDENGDPLDIAIDSTITEDQKLAFLTSEKTSGGGVDGYDVAMTLSADMGTLAAKSSDKVVFAYVFGYSVEELIENVAKAKAKYASFITTPLLNKTVSACHDQEVDLGNEYEMALYADPLGADLIASGMNLILTGFSKDTSFYYQEIVDGYASDLYRLLVDIVNPKVAFRADPEVLYLGDIVNNRVQFIDESLGAVEWSWDFDNGSFASLQNPKSSFNEVGTYEVVLSIVTTQGCQDQLIQAYEVKERGEAPIVSDQSVCAGETATVSASNSNELNFYATAMDENPFFSGAQWISDPVLSDMTVYVSSVAGSEESVRVPVLLDVDDVKAQFTFVQDTLDFTSSQLIDIQDESEGAVSVLWQINGVAQGSESNWTYNYTGQSALVIKQIATSDLGCLDSLTVDLGLAESIRPGISGTTKCKWDDIIVKPGYGTRFVFYADAALQQIIAKGRTATLGPLTSDTTFYITNISDFLESEPVEFNVNLTDHDPAILATPDSLLLSGARQVSFSASTGNIAAYRWHLNDVLVETAPSPILTLDTLGVYRVKLIATHNLGCRDTSYLDYKVFEILSLGDEIEGFSFYPNPATDELHIEFGNEQSIENLAVFNVLGQRIAFRQENKNGHIVIDLHQMEAGVYLISGKVNNQPFRRKFHKL